jgi:NADH-quinone oxidoreductase subunit A
VKQAYIPILMLLGASLLNAVVLVVLSHLVHPPRPTPVKVSPYESGILPLGDTRERFSVKFYLVALLFIVFDVETVFLYPWAVVFRDALEAQGVTLLVVMGIFVALLGLGLLYEWRKGGLEWD